ncbi:MAG: hypothetical protein ACI9JL_000442 [Paracoccaceae bacterium]
MKKRSYIFFFAPQGLQGFFALQGLQGFFAAQGFFALHGLQGFFAAHGFFALHGPQAAIWTSVSLEMPAAAAGIATVPAARATTLRVVMVFLIIDYLPMTIRKSGTAEEFRCPSD